MRRHTKRGDQHKNHPQSPRYPDSDFSTRNAPPLFASLLATTRLAVQVIKV
jgi:hypothetical protein